MVPPVTTISTRTTSTKRNRSRGGSFHTIISHYTMMYTRWFLLFLIVHHLPLPVSSSYNETAILQAFYESTNGPSWRNNSQWLSTTADNPCDWYGITCTQDSQQVMDITLKENNLNGEIPTSLWSLSSLESINLRKNLLAAVNWPTVAMFPVSPLELVVLGENHIQHIQGVGQFQETLQSLNIIKNQLSGTIPADLWECTKLDTLYLAFNELQGSLSTQVGQLTRLLEFYAFDNRLTGSLPTELGLLDQLRILGLGNNRFTGTLPTQMEAMVNLHDLSIHQTSASSVVSAGLEGPLLTFADMPYLSLLYLDGNALTGTISSDFLRHNEQIAELVSIGLSYNKLTGTLPKSLERFQSLTMDLVGNAFVEIPDEICKQGGWMGGLVEEFGCDAILCGRGTYNELGRAFSSTHPCVECEAAVNETILGATACVSELENPTTLELLAEFYFQLSGPKWTLREGWALLDLIESGGTLVEIADSDVDVCDWYGIICDSQGNITDLSMSNNGLFGSIPHVIFRIASLETFDVSNNNVGLADLQGVALASGMKSLTLSNTKLQSLTGISNLTALEHLFLDGLALPEPIPQDLFDLTNLKTLHLQHSQFTGTLPTRIGLLTKLRNLNMYGNALGGTLPTELGSLASLRTLELSENLFSGSIPTQIGSLSDLEVLAIHQTDNTANLTGPLPAFETLTELQEMDLSSNSLTGTIPESFLIRISDKSSEIVVSLGLNELTGAIPASLNSFDAMVLNLEGNRITSIPSVLCQKSNWMQGEVGKLDSSSSCNAILCPPGTFNDFGKEAEDGPCYECNTTDVSLSAEWPSWYGRTQCGTIVQTREKEILDTLFAQTGGRYWTGTHDNWLKPGTPICKREGIECANENANEGVREIRLLNFGLRGTIPKDIWELTSARLLAFTSNEVDVSFDGIEQAEALVVLKLSQCNLRTLAGISQVSSSLRELHLAENQFNGTIPKEIFDLSQVELVFLNNNHFSGTIPSDISKMSGLTKLELWNNLLAGPIPSEIGLLTSLTDIALQKNRLSGTIPTELQNLPQLEILDISTQTGEQFTGPLPSFENSPFLFELHASECGFSGTLPSNLLSNIDSSSQQEVSLDLAGNKFEGPIPVEWSRFQSLTVDLSGNKISSIPSEICALNEWNSGLVGLFSTCDAILCPPGTQLPAGRQTEAMTPCSPCEAGVVSAPYYGSVACLDARMASERRILTDFYNNADGSNWLEQTNWLSDESVCTWFGVKCNEDEHVTEIHLVNNMLDSLSSDTATMSSILSLQDLTTLDLKENKLPLDFQQIADGSVLEFIRVSGTRLSSLDGISKASLLKALHATNNAIKEIPDEIFGMTSLESLFLSYNEIAGTLSSHIGQLTSLKELYIFENHLTGSIPTTVGLLTSLRELILAKNSLSGSLPQALSSLPSLEQVSVYDQQGADLITGPVPSFSGSPLLWYFDASDNDLTGPLPDNFLINSVFSNKTLAIYLQNNEITGTIPAELSRFDSLDINLADNHILRIPDSLCSLSGWMEGQLGVIGNCSGILCPAGTFNQFGHAKEDSPCLPCSHFADNLYLGHAHCEDFTSERETLLMLYSEAGGDFWTNSTKWQTDAPICSWEGVSCEDGDLQDEEGITKLNLPQNSMTGTLPSQIWTLPTLRYLNLQDNPNLHIGFEGLSSASDSLESLILTDTHMTSLDGISQATQLKELYVASNSLKGTFPSEIFSLSDTLKALYIGDNLFHGTLPTELGQMTTLTALNAHDNDFFSTIPTELGLMEELKILVLSENLVYGQMPDQMSSMQQMQILSCYRLDKSGPRLTGTLPSFNLMPQLRNLNFEGNELEGTIPSDFTSASLGMKKILLGRNKLTGTVPEDLEQKGVGFYLGLENNLIEGFPESFCEQISWMGGAIKAYGCEGFLCPPGKASLGGRSSGSSQVCEACTEGTEGIPEYYGATSCGPSVTQREILVNLFYALDGSNWHRKDFWGSTADVCDWYGIGCKNGKVVIINLRGNNLSGLPGPDLFFLPELRTLWLYSNPIQFSFENIEQATKLEDLRLDSTLLHSLHGVGNAISLISLDASYTAIRGSFPEEEILQLTNLRTLQLNNNALSGSLPKSWAPLRYLVSLRLEKNSFTGSLPSFEDLNYLNYLDISGNQLSGTVSTSFLGLVDDASNPTIRLSKNQITGVVPLELDRFEELTLLMGGNKILGLPVTLCDNKKWNSGDVGDHGCIGILCTPGYYSASGRQSRTTTCSPCPSATYYGAMTCGTKSSAGALQSPGGWIWVTCILALLFTISLGP